MHYNPRNTLYVLLTVEEHRSVAGTFEDLSLVEVRVASDEDIRAELDSLSAYAKVLQNLADRLKDFIESRMFRNFAAQLKIKLDVKNLTFSEKTQIGNMLQTFYSEMNELFSKYKAVFEGTNADHYVVPKFVLNGEVERLEDINTS